MANHMKDERSTAGGNPPKPPAREQSREEIRARQAAEKREKQEWIARRMREDQEAAEREAREKAEWIARRMREDEEQEAPQPGEGPQDAVATRWFILDDTLIATQQAREGDAIARPEDPVCPEGMAFGGWFLEDGTRLFIDADGDGEADPVIAHPDPLCPEVNVIGKYLTSSVEDASAEDARADAPADDAADEAQEEDAPANGAQEGMEVTAPESADAESDG